MAVPGAAIHGNGESRGPQVASPAMTDAAVGGLESAAEPRGPDRITFPCFDGFRALAAIVVLVTHVAFLSGFNGRSRFGAEPGRRSRLRSGGGGACAASFRSRRCGRHHKRWLATQPDAPNRS